MTAGIQLVRMTYGWGWFVLFVLLCTRSFSVSPTCWSKAAVLRLVINLFDIRGRDKRDVAIKANGSTSYLYFLFWFYASMVVIVNCITEVDTFCAELLFCLMLFCLSRLCVSNMLFNTCVFMRCWHDHSGAIRTGRDDLCKCCLSINATSLKRVQTWCLWCF